MTRFILCLSLLVSLPLCGQQPNAHFLPTFFENQAFAHRGGYAFGPENTLETILYNVGFGVRAFEVDVMLTKDGELVLFHDDSIQRVLSTTDTKRVSEMTLDELKQYKLRDQRFGDVSVTTLQELFDTLLVSLSEEVLSDFILELDFKPHGEETAKGVKKLLEVVNREVENHGENLYNYFFLSSFYPEVLKEIRKSNQQLVTAFSVNNSSDKHKLKGKLAVFFAPMIIRKTKTSIIEPNICLISTRFVRKYHKKGIMINAWTANTKCEKEYLSQFSIAHTTNCPYDSCDTDPSDQVGKPKKWCKGCAK